MIIVFALAAAVLYGSADFLGGAASRRLRASSVLTVSGPVGAAVLVVAALLAGGAPAAAGIPWAAAAGACGGVGLMVFYAGLAAGPMRVVAPVSALMSTVLPVGVAIATGERPGLAVYVGGLICVLATVLVSMEGRADPGGRPPGPPDRRSAPSAGRPPRFRGASALRAEAGSTGRSSKLCQPCPPGLRLLLVAPLYAGLAQQLAVLLLSHPLPALLDDGAHETTLTRD